jgi:hypothetical protein
MSPVDQEQSGPRARESPADDEEGQDDQNFGHPKSPDHSDGGPAEIPIFSSKRKVGILSEEDPVAGTIDQLREELLQLRQQRDDRDRQIAQLTLLRQNVLEGKAVAPLLQNPRKFLARAKAQAKTEIPFCPLPSTPLFLQLQRKRGARVRDKERILLTCQCPAQRPQHQARLASTHRRSASTLTTTKAISKVRPPRA